MSNHYFRRSYKSVPQELTEDEFWEGIFQEFMFGGQPNVDNMERCLLDGKNYVGSVHMYWITKKDQK